MPEYITKFKEKTVLLLGDYDEPGLKRLESMAAALSLQGYDPILIKDIPDQLVQDLPQKVSTIGYLARFVVVDDSTSSGHLAEVQLCRQHDWITVLLRRGGLGASWMTAGASVSSNVILEQGYDELNPEPSLAKVAQWAERKIKELERKFNNIFPWRMPG